MEDLRPWFVFIPIDKVAAFEAALMAADIPVRCQCRVRDSATLKVWSSITAIDDDAAAHDDAEVATPSQAAGAGSTKGNEFAPRV